jgi:hypothetical protein
MHVTLTGRLHGRVGDGVLCLIVRVVYKAVITQLLDTPLLHLIKARLRAAVPSSEGSRHRPTVDEGWRACDVSRGRKGTLHICGLQGAVGSLRDGVMRG